MVYVLDGEDGFLDVVFKDGLHPQNSRLITSVRWKFVVNMIEK